MITIGTLLNKLIFVAVNNQELDKDSGKVVIMDNESLYVLVAQQLKSQEIWIFVGFFFQETNAEPVITFFDMTPLFYLLF